MSDPRDDAPIEPGDAERPVPEPLVPAPLVPDAGPQPDELGEFDFEVEAPPAAAPSTPSGPEDAPAEVKEFVTRRPGPGLPESLLWTGGVHIVQLVLAVPVVVAVMLIHVALGGRVAGPEDVEQVFSSRWILFLGLWMPAFVLATIVLVGARLWNQPRRRLGLVGLSPVHALLVGLSALPLGALGGHLYHVGSEHWQRIVDEYPGLRALDEMSTMEALPDLVERAPLPALLLIIAVCPAISEELVFRGAIGRGLVARWGVVAGIALTTLLFAIVHVHPAHALGVVPIGIALHVVHLATRSLWAPMLLHFLNNALATVLLKFEGVEVLQPLAENARLSSLELAVYGGLLLVLMGLLWLTRVQYVLPDGRVWDPGYPSVEAPPPQTGAVRRMKGVRP